jgi:hypothetical protein
MKSKAMPGGDELADLHDALGSSFLHVGRPTPTNEEAARDAAEDNEEKGGA